MQIEHEVKVIPIDENFQTEVEKLRSDGWEIVPGVKPIAIYHLARLKKEEKGLGGVGRLVIDDSKVSIIPASELQ